MLFSLKDLPASNDIFRRRKGDKSPCLIVKKSLKLKIHGMTQI